MKVTNNKYDFDIPKTRPKNRIVVEIHLVHWKVIFGSKNEIFNVEAADKSYMVMGFSLFFSR